MARVKICQVCREALNEVAFNRSRRAADGLAPVCRACVTAQRRESVRTCVPTISAAAELARALRTGDLAKLQHAWELEKQPPWDWVCETMRDGHLAVAEFLLNAGAERNIFTWCAVANVKGLRQLLRRSPASARQETHLWPGGQQITALHVACAVDWTNEGDRRQRDQLTVAQLLVDTGADVASARQYRNLPAVTPLLCACWTSRNLTLVDWLLQQGAVPGDREFLAALGHFQRHGREAYQIAERLLEQGVPVDGGRQGERTPLQAFAHQGSHQTVAWLLAHGAQVNARGPGGRTAAHFAAERNTGLKTLQVLADNGAQFGLPDAGGQTPLQVALRSGKPRVAQWLADQQVKNGPTG